MTTYALVFSTDFYERKELEKMSEKDLYELASQSATLTPEEADMLTLDELSRKVNDEELSLDFSWLYFVTI